MSYRSAPKLYHKGEKGGGYFYQLPHDLMDIVFNTLDGRHGNALKIMVVLIGTQGDGHFGISEKWVLKRTSMSKQKYYETLKFLESIGFIYRNEQGIVLDIETIMSRGNRDESQSMLDSDKEGPYLDSNSFRNDDHNNNVIIKEKKKKFRDNGCLSSYEEEIKYLLTSIGVSYSSYTQGELEHAAGEKLDPSVLRVLISKNRSTWSTGKLEGQNYLYVALKRIIEAHYQSNKRTLEAERIVAEREREEAKRIPRINYDDMIRCEPQEEGLGDISYLLDDDEEE